MQPTRVYFPGLNGLRFFAALAVIVTHVELMKKFAGFDNTWIDSGSRVKSYAFDQIRKGDFHWSSPLVAEAGPLGVIFFFVLSGFLITYLLLQEKKITGEIAIKAFYLRRIYRIWPLYFLVFLIGFFVLPHINLFYVRGQTEAFFENFTGNLICYLLFLPNLAYSLFMAVPNIGQSWSIGVEEQFYIIWPLVIGYFSKTLRAIVVFTILFLALKAMILFAGRLTDFAWLIPVQKFFAMSKIECMTMGGLGAYFLFYRHTGWLKIIYHPLSQLTAICGVPFLVYFTPTFLQDGIHIAHAVCFLIILINVSCNPRSFIRLENNTFNFLGKISYGIYMYHLMCVVLVINIMKATMDTSKVLTTSQNLIIYSMSVVLTILISYFSYEYFELRFIRLKKSVTRVVSGNEARN